MAPALATKAAVMPSTTGRSIPIDPIRNWLHAARYRGCAEKRITGSVSTRLAMRISCSMSAGTSPGAAKYSGTASIITCIMPSQAMATRSSSTRRTRRSSTGTRPAS